MTQDYLAWVDVETTGLNSNESHLLEVALIVTDWDLNVLDEGYSRPVAYSAGTAEGLRDSSNEFVRKMHDKTGLWERLEGPDAMPLERIDSDMEIYLRMFAPEPRQARLAGNSVFLDLEFTRAFLPKFYKHLHYRFFDVTGLQEAAHRWLDVPHFEKRLEHSALSDIRESIEQARFIKEHLQR